MNILLFAFFLSIVSFLSSLYALTRVRRLEKLTAYAGYEDIADMQGDVAALKTQLRKVNSRIAGFHEPKHDSVAEAKAILESVQNVQPMQNLNRGG